MNSEFIQAIKDLGLEKGIDPEILYDAIEVALKSGYKNHFNNSADVRVDINRETGDCHVYSVYTVVEDVEDKATEMSIEEARKHRKSVLLGDQVEIEVTPKNFGRKAAQNAKQLVVQRIREAERNIIYDEFVDRADDIITGLIYRNDGRNVYIDLGKTEAVLPQTEQVQIENYQPGKRIKAYVIDVKKTSKGPQIIVSRTHPGLLKRLFELEVPEIFNGVVEIKSIAREPGYRSKIAVYSSNENVDPVGACVGPKGVRVQTIVNELNGEKIDIVTWNEDPAIFVQNALSPAKVVSVHLCDEESKKANVVVPDYQLSLAIGREGQNARLAAKLTSWKIDIKSEKQIEEMKSIE